jgi:hypothetical protein
MQGGIAGTSRRGEAAHPVHRSRCSAVARCLAQCVSSDGRPRGGHGRSVPLLHVPLRPATSLDADPSCPKSGVVLPSSGHALERAGASFASSPLAPRRNPSIGAPGDACDVPGAGTGGGVPVPDARAGACGMSRPIRTARPTRQRSPCSFELVASPPATGPKMPPWAPGFDRRRPTASHCGVPFRRWAP